MCGMKFAHKSELKAHYRSAHSEMVGSTMGATIIDTIQPDTFNVSNSLEINDNDASSAPLINGSYNVSVSDTCCHSLLSCMTVFAVLFLCHTFYGDI